MYTRPRIIPTVLLNDCDLVKTKKFREPNYLGDPINAVKIFNEKGVDELCVLDISATLNKKEPNYELLSKMASEAFMPLSYGGGINNIDQAKRLFRLGFEKIVINSISNSNPTVISEIADYFGSQSVVGAIDYKKHFIFGESCYISSGRINTKIKPIDMARKYEELGCGEILLYSIDNDGMRKGFDIETICKVSKVLSIPLIACGGANDVNDIQQAIEAGANAVAAGSMFVYFGKRQAVLINYPEEEVFFKLGIYSY